MPKPSSFTVTQAGLPCVAMTAERSETLRYGLHYAK